MVGLAGWECSSLVEEVLLPGQLQPEKAYATHFATSTGLTRVSQTHLRPKTRQFHPDI